jgi:hypothetical protein
VHPTVLEVIKYDLNAIFAWCHLVNVAYVYLYIYIYTCVYVYQRGGITVCSQLQVDNAKSQEVRSVSWN